MTRERRPGEKDGESAIFITNKQFEDNFKNGVYMEPSLDFACLKALGVYYGTPIEWLKYLKCDDYCASPVSISIANDIYEKIKIIWIHLYCNDYDRYERLLSRGISMEEVEKRMKSGDSINFPDNATLINTSEMYPEEIIEKVRRLKR
jgi:guanylate kinase